MLADTPLPHGFGAALASVDTFSKGSRTVRYLPALSCRLPCDGTHGLIEFLLSRQSFSAALQVALRVADHSPRTSSFALHNTISGLDGHISALWFVRVKTQDLNAYFGIAGEPENAFLAFLSRPQSVS
jgi:hypothetical protein